MSVRKKKIVVAYCKSFVSRSTFSVRLNWKQVFQSIHEMVLQSKILLKYLSVVFQFLVM